MPSGRLRLAGSVAVVVLTVVATGACTGEQPSALSASTTSAGSAAARASSSDGPSGSAASTVAPGGGAAAVGTNTTVPAPDPAMTTIAEASACTTRTDLAGRAPVRPEQLWPGASEIGFSSAQVQARAGSVAGGAPCQAVLPATPDCDLTFPWGAVSNEDLVVASGAQRLLTGRSYARLAASSDAVKGSASLLYSVLDFGSPGTRVDVVFRWYETAVERCSLGARGSIGGVPGLVGSGHRPTLLSTVPGRFLISVTGPRVVVLVFEGGAWSDTSRADATRRALPLLLAS
jgi:hypothetical protein